MFLFIFFLACQGGLISKNHCGGSPGLQPQEASVLWGLGLVKKPLLCLKTFSVITSKKAHRDHYQKYINLVS